MYNTLFFKLRNPYNCRLLIWNNIKIGISPPLVKWPLTILFNFTILKIIFPILSALKLFAFLFLCFSINSILNIMSSKRFNYIFHLPYYSFILNLHGLLSRRIYFTLFIRFFYISDEVTLVQWRDW